MKYEKSKEDSKTLLAEMAYAITDMKWGLPPLSCEAGEHPLAI